MFKKKVILTVAAAAAVAVSSPMIQKASAAENTTSVQKKVYVYQSNNLTDLNSSLQKYVTSLGDKTTTNTTSQTQPSTQTTNSQQQQITQTTSSTLSAYEQKVLDLTNQERAKNGLTALKVDTTLSKVARTKSLDMSNNNYFSHTSPTYGSPFDMMKTFGITYKSAGENIAMGQKTPEEVVQAWMNSDGHRANILNANYNYIGVGYAEQGNYWTQEFIGK
ncbi:CAP domain-containing protein [Neobacillus drentensis]|uniref:CAP domain-containing protein n=1 Tax=Neobacillus drentensis TaxID=220684 RepID=UPI002FFDB858